MAALVRRVTTQCFKTFQLYLPGDTLRVTGLWTGARSIIFRRRDSLCMLMAARRRCLLNWSIFSSSSWRYGSQNVNALEIDKCSQNKIQIDVHNYIGDLSFTILEHRILTARVVVLSLPLIFAKGQHTVLLTWIPSFMLPIIFLFFVYKFY